MTSDQLVTCVKGVLAQTSGTAASTGIVGTLQQYAIPLAIAGVLVVGAVVVMYQGQSKKKPYKPVAKPTKEPEEPKKAPRRYR